MAQPLRELGWRPVPLDGKNPNVGGADWKRQRDDHDFAALVMRHSGRNTGIVIDHGLVAIDIDYDDDATADAAGAVFDAVVGPTPLVRIGKPPHSMRIYRTSDDRVVNAKPGKIEVFAQEGGQIAAFGTHPDTNKAFHWADSSPRDLRPDDASIPEINLEKLLEALERIDHRTGDDLARRYRRRRPETTESDVARGGREEILLGSPEYDLARRARVIRGWSDDYGEARGRLLVECPKLCDHSPAAAGGAPIDRPQDAALFVGTDGRVGFACRHSHARGKPTLRDLRHRFQRGIPGATKGRSSLPAPKLGQTYTDTGSAERFARLLNGDVRMTDSGAWAVFRSTHWDLTNVRGGEHEIMNLTKLVIDDLDREYDEIFGQDVGDTRLKPLKLHKDRLLTHERRRALVKLLPSEGGVLPVSDFDIHPTLVNCQNGTLDLDAGALRAHRREDLITKIIPVDYDPAAKAPRWERFLSDVLGDPDVISFVQRLLGYAMSGLMDEHVLTFFVGGGANGKTTLLETISDVLGPYADAADSSLIATRGGDRRSENLDQARVASLQGLRLVTIEELPAGARISENLVKALTGGGRVQAAFKYGNPFTFSPTNKTIVATNYAPNIQGSDHGIWRRIAEVPFEREFLTKKDAADRGLDFESLPTPSQSAKGPYRADPGLREQLLRERPGILRWQVDGYRKWRAGGLQPPEKVLQATAGLRDEQDLVRGFLDACTFKESDSTPTALLRASFSQYAGEEVSDALFRILRESLRARGYRNVARGGRRVWLGVGVPALANHAPHWSDK